MTTTGKAVQIKSLADWVARWPKNGTLGFDPETREPSVYAPSKPSDAYRTKTATIAWKREGDILTILSNPSDFSDSIVKASSTEIEKILASNELNNTATNTMLQQATSDLLSRWREYSKAPIADRGVIMRQIIDIEQRVKQLEEQMALKRYNIQINKDKEYIATYTPPVPTQLRGINLLPSANATSL